MVPSSPGEFVERLVVVTGTGTSFPWEGSFVGR